jgi:hypothetical protein
MPVFTAIAGAILGAGASAAAISSLALNLALTTASIAYQIYRTNKLKAELDKRKQVNVAVDGEPFYLPVVYGRAKVSGGKVIHKLKNNFKFASEDSVKNTEGPFYSLTGSKYYFKLVTKTSSSVSLKYSYETTVEIYWANVSKASETPNVVELSIVDKLFLGSYTNTGAQAVNDYDSNDGFTYVKGKQISSSSTVVPSDPSITETTTWFEVSRYNTSSRQQVFSSKLNADRSGSKNEYLFLQQAICYGGINRVVDITVDDKNWDEETLQYGQRIVVDLNGGAASALATANGFPTTNTFTNTAYATMCFRLNREEYNYNGSPNVSFFVEGAKVKDVVFNSSTGVYSLTENKIYSNNPSLVLLDYLTNPIYGKGLPVTFLDLKSFYVAKLISSSLVLSDLARDGRVNGRRPDVEKEDGTIEKQPELSKYAIPLYECNVVLDTERAIRENIELILESMEEAELVWSGGKYKLVVNSPRTQEDIEALIALSFDEDDIIRGGMELDFPDSSTRYNQCVARFLNEFENFVDDTVTWPPAYSTAYNTYLEEDSGVLLKTEVYLPCTSDPYHALAKAEQIVRTSRRAMRAKFTVGKKGLVLEPGDIIEVTDASSGLDKEIMKVESVKASADLTAVIEARQYDISTFAWNVPDDVPYISPKIEFYYKVTPPSNVVFTPDGGAGLFGVSSGKLTWSFPDTIAVAEFVIEISNDNGVTWQTLSTSLAPSLDITGLNTGVYKFSVRSRGQSGKLSERVIATDLEGDESSFTIQRATADQVAVVYADSPNILTNTQSYSPGTNKYNAYYVYSGDLPTLPIRSGISFSRFVAENSLTLRVEVRTKPSGVSWDSTLEPQTTDPSTWPFSNAGTAFRNDTGEIKALVAFVYDGDQLLDLNTHYNQIQYSWLQGESIYVSNISGSNRFSRWIPVSASEVVADSQFICDATIT